MKILVEIICIGNELLIGKTLNTNSQWLAKQITNLGLVIHRITTVSDDINEISASIQEAINRKVSFILTTGGLGPTFDDKTLEGIGKSIKSKTDFNEKALKMVKEKYLTYFKGRGINNIDLSSCRKKMAKLPNGAIPLPNQTGTAPGVYVEYENVKIIALPGVPSEMKNIFNESIAPIMKKIRNKLAFFEKSIHTSNVMESAIAPAIEKIMKNNPSVYIKSHPKGTESVSNIEFHLSTTIHDPNIANQNLKNAIYQLKQKIKEKGGKILLENSKS